MGKSNATFQALFKHLSRLKFTEIRIIECNDSITYTVFGIDFMPILNEIENDSNFGSENDNINIFIVENILSENTAIFNIFSGKKICTR